MKRHNCFHIAGRSNFLSLGAKELSGVGGFWVESERIDYDAGPVYVLAPVHWHGACGDT